jgi:hypothetical protein
MDKTIPLDEQIVAVLRQACTSDQAAAVLADARRELADLIKRADAADVASLNPLATGAEARKLRNEANDHRFEADRMEASVSALDARLSELRSAEVRAQRQAEERDIIAERDELAADIAREYPKIVATLTALAKRGVENDQRIANASLRNVLPAELVARGLTGHYVNHSPVLRLHQIKIQMPDAAWLAFGESIDGWDWRGLSLAETAEA